jgi:hypothetical protein
MGIPPSLISDLSMVLKRSLILAFSCLAPVAKGTLVVETSRKSIQANHRAFHYRSEWEVEGRGKPLSDDSKEMAIVGRGD